MLLLHGNPLTLVTWYLITPRLAKDFTTEWRRYEPVRLCVTMALDSLMPLCWSSSLGESMTLMSFSATFNLGHAHAEDPAANVWHLVKASTSRTRGATTDPVPPLRASADA